MQRAMAAGDREAAGGVELRKFGAHPYADRNGSGETRTFGRGARRAGGGRADRFVLRNDLCVSRKYFRSCGKSRAGSKGICTGGESESAESGGAGGARPGAAVSESAALDRFRIVW